MSERFNNALREGGRNVEKGVNAAGRTGKTAVEGMKKLNGSASTTFIPLKWKLAIAGGLVVFLLVVIFIPEVLNSTQMDENFYRTPMKESSTFAPEEDEKMEAKWDLSRALKQTIDLSSVIHEAKKKERESIEKSLQKDGAGSYKIICESDISPVLINENYPMDGGSGYGGISKSSRDVINGACAWAEAIANDDSFHYGESSWAHHNGCYFCDTQHPDKRNSGGDWEKTYCCNPFVHAAFAHGGGDPTMLERCQSGVGYGTTYSDGWSGDSNWVNVGNLPRSELKKGDVLLTGSHAMLYIGDGKVAHAGSADDGVRGSNAWNNSIRVDEGIGYSQVLRYKGRGGGQMQVPSGNTSSKRNDGFKSSVVDWVEETVASGSFYCGTRSYKCPLCNPGTGNSWNDVGFAFASWHHGGELDSKCSGSVMGTNQFDRLLRVSQAKGTGYVTKKLGVQCKVIKNGRAGLPESMLEPGDIIVMYAGGSYNHVAVYLGNSQYAEASGNGSLLRINGNYADIENSVKVAIRYIGLGGSGTIGSSGGEADNYTKKDSVTVLEEISSDTGSRKSIGFVRGTSANCAQSFAFVKGQYGVAIVTSDEPPSYVQTYDKECNPKSLVRNDDMIHANGACETHDGKLLVAGRLGGNRSGGELFNVGESVTTAGSIDLPSSAAAIAYDRETEKYILSAGTTMRVYDKTMTKELTSISRSMHNMYFQDIGASHGFIFACHTEEKGRENYGSNYIDIFNEETGDYCGSYYLNYGELESCDVVDGELVLLVHILGFENYIQNTGIMIGDGGGASREGYTTKSDLDILAAYSVTISNTGIYKNEETDETWKIFSDDGDEGTDNYTDIRGNKLKLYWFGENKGRVNYKADLKNKLSSFWSQVSFYDELRGQDAADALEADIEAGRASSAAGTKISDTENLIYLREKSLPDILRQLDVDPDASFTGSGPDNMLAASNLEAACGISDNTEHMLYTDSIFQDNLADGITGDGTFINPLGTASYVITSRFTNGNLRTDVNTGRPHNGIDLGAPTGTPVYASQGGTVKLAEYYGGYGNCVIIENGDTEVIYGHLSEIIAKENTVVPQGQKIGLVGSTGFSTGPHLHFEVQINGKPVDPETLLDF